jgi:hypothetical protein
VVSELGAQGATHLLDPRLADRVRRGQHGVHEGVDGRHDDDMTAACGDLGEAGADRPPDPEQVDLHDPLEYVRVDDAQRGGGRRHAGVGDDHVEAPEALHRGGYRRLEGLPIGGVGRHGQGAITDRLRGPLGRLPVQVDEHDRRAPLMQKPRRLEADAPRSAGQEGDLSTKAEARHAGGDSMERVA